MSDENKYLQEIGINLRKMRDHAGLSQQELANDCNIAKSTIQRIEKGTLNPSITTVVSICEVLQVDITQFVRCASKK